MVDETGGSSIGRRTVLAGTGAAVTAALAGCLDDVVGAGQDVRSTQVETFDAADLTALTVETPSGAVTVRGDDRETIDLTAEKRAGSREALEAATLSVERTDGRLDLAIEIERSGSLDVTGPAVDLELTVPADLRVARAESVDGDVDVSGVAGELTAETTDGTVTVSDLSGDVTAATIDGGVDVERVDGDVRVEATDADVEISSVTGDASVDVVSGDVTVSDVDGEVRT